MKRCKARPPPLRRILEKVEFAADCLSGAISRSLDSLIAPDARRGALWGLGEAGRILRQAKRKARRCAHIRRPGPEIKKGAPSGGAGNKKSAAATKEVRAAFFLPGGDSGAAAERLECRMGAGKGLKALI
jgi:hypothetical protein